MTTGKVAREPQWLPLSAVVAFNRLIVEAAGEHPSSCDEKRLRPAIAQLWNMWAYFLEGDIAVLAARLFAGIAAAQAFRHGNRRTAFVAAVAFIEANGHQFTMPDQEAAAGRPLDFLDRRLSQAGLVEWFRLWIG